MPDDNKSQLSDGLSRRSILGSGMLGASALLAGCSGGGDGGGGTPTETGTETTGMQTTETTRAGTETPTETATPTPPAHVSGQSLTWYTMQNPAELTWLTGGWLDPINPSGKYTNGHAGYELTMQNGTWGPWSAGPVMTPETVYEHYEQFDITPKEVTIKLRDDANWSNGDPVTAPDALYSLIEFRLTPFVLPAPGDLEEAPLRVQRAVTDYEILSDKEFKIISEPGFFDTYPKARIWTQFTRYGVGGTEVDTNIEPYDQMWNLVDDWWSMAKNGELDPWASDWSKDDVWDIYSALPEKIKGPHGWSSNEQKNNYDMHWEKQFRDPNHVATSGAWTLKAINGTQSVTLEPNTEHYASDWVNFDEIEIVARPSERANRSALKANSQDYYVGTVPNYIVQSFPDSITQRMVPATGGLGYAVDHKSKLFSNRKARQAIMYAIDRQRIAQSVHRTKYDPVQVPGGNAWDAPSVLGEDWISNNLQSYGRDLNKATQLMEEAGFTQEGGQWVDQEGNALSVTIPTAEQTPTLGPAFANQLSQFGIDASLQTYSGSIFTEKRRNGEFSISPRDWGTGYIRNAVCHPWLLTAGFENIARVQTRIYSKEEYQTYYEEMGGKSTPESMRTYTLKAPPVGEPDGDLKTYHPGLIGLNTRYPKSIDHYREWARPGAWLMNWFLPTLPIANGQTQQFLDTGHWNWPAADSMHWQNVGAGGHSAEHVVAPGRYVHANPENPESGASVEN